MSSGYRRGRVEDEEGMSMEGRLGIKRG